MLQDEINNFIDGATSSRATALADLELGDTVRDRRRPGHDARDEGRGLRVDGRGRRRRPDGRGLHRPRLLAAGRGEHRACRRSLNFTKSDSMGIGGAIVAQRRLERRRGADHDTPVTAGSLTVEATEAATIIAATDVTASSSGGSSFTGSGQSLAAGGVIATNRVLSSARALVDRQRDHDHGRRRHRERDERLADPGDDAGRDELGLPVRRRSSSRSTPSAGDARTCSSPRSTRCSAIR